MISRVADHCFWLGRYLERVEATARLLQVTGALALDAELTPAQCWAPLIITAGEQQRFPELIGAELMGDGDAVSRYLTLDQRVGVSLIRSVAAARENARSIREVISREAWETLNALYLSLQGSGVVREFDEERDALYRRVRREVQLCVGLLEASMLHDHPLHFVRLGLVLERVGQTARTLDVHHHAFLYSVGREGSQVVQVSLWLALLRACYGFEAFMKTHRGVITSSAVASFLIFEPRFPRSVRHGLTEALDKVARLRPPSVAVADLACAGRLTGLGLWLEERRATRELDARMVHELLTRVVDETHSICDLVQEELIHAVVAHRSVAAMSQRQG